jgi:pantothenate kinase-related protein Tda10
MQVEINTFIQEHLKQLTNKTFSKKYISQYIAPIINNINTSKDKKFIIAGSQGAGKSTLAILFKLALEKIYKKKVMLLSIDDYYLSKKKRLIIKKIIPIYYCWISRSWQIYFSNIIQISFRENI